LFVVVLSGGGESVVEFVAVGPVKIPVYKPKLGGRRIDEKLDVFWDSVEDVGNKVGCNTIKGGKGCYVFCMRAGKGIVPFYVGKTNAQNLLKETYNPNNIKRYNGVISERKGAPVMFFIVANKKQGPTNAKAIKALEKFLIEQAYERNKDIINKQHAKLPQWSIRHVMLSKVRGKPPKGAAENARAFKAMMGFS